MLLCLSKFLNEKLIVLPQTSLGLPSMALDFSPQKKLNARMPVPLNHSLNCPQKCPLIIITIIIIIPNKVSLPLSLFHREFDSIDAKTGQRGEEEKGEEKEEEDLNNNQNEEEEESEGALGGGGGDRGQDSPPVPRYIYLTY